AARKTGWGCSAASWPATIHSADSWEAFSMPVSDPYYGKRAKAKGLDTSRTITDPADVYRAFHPRAPGPENLYAAPAAGPSAATPPGGRGPGGSFVDEKG